MSEMISFNHRSTMGYIFAFVDGVLVLAAVLLAGIIHPSVMDSMFRTELYPVGKIMLVVIVVEMTHFYLDLIDLKFIRGRIQMSLQLCKALGVYSVILVVIYFMVPAMAIGHRALLVSLGLIFLVTFFWRLLYPWIASNGLLGKGSDRRDGRSGTKDIQGNGGTWTGRLRNRGFCG
jgi:hypothetical protein